MNLYIITGQYRQDIHANVQADSPHEAVLQAKVLFEKWLETMHNDVAGVTFGPEEPTLDDDVMLTSAKDSTPDDPTYWTEAVELSIYDVEGALA